jgi:hypothetical protein
MQHVRSVRLYTLSYGSKPKKHRTGFEPMSPTWRASVLDRARLTMRMEWSEWEDLNLRELVPRTSASASRLHSVKKFGMPPVRIALTPDGLRVHRSTLSYGGVKLAEPARLELA